jgi:hypothetical protein
MSTVTSDRPRPVDTRTLAGPKRWRKLQAVRVIASMKAITVD